MDPVFQLFTADEILQRLGHKRATGCLHIFTHREAANIFFKDGIVVAAAKGLAEGEEVLKGVLGWKDARNIWQPDVPPSMSFKALQINIKDFIAREKPASEISTAPKNGTSEPIPVLAPIPVKNTATVPVSLPVAPPPDPTSAAKFAPKPVNGSAPVQLTATKTVSQSAQARSAQEEALLNKHRLTIVSVDDPQQRVKISRVSCLVGRNPACDISLNHNSVSRQHCLLQITDRGLHVKDLGTTNGTKVNGIGMTEGYINVGDKLTMGHLIFILEKDAA